MRIKASAGRKQHADLFDHCESVVLTATDDDEAKVLARLATLLLNEQYPADWLGDLLRERENQKVD